MTEYTEKKVKAVKKEGGKKGQDLEGMAAMGSLFQQAVMTTPEGKMDLLEMTLEAMNQEVDPEGEERRGGGKDVAKILLSSDDEQFSCIVDVPEMYTQEDKNERAYAFSATKWAEAAFATLPGDGKGAEYLESTATRCRVHYKKDAAAGHYPQKAMDAVSGASFAWLRTNALVCDDDDSDDDFVFGDDDMPGI